MRIAVLCLAALLLAGCGVPEDEVAQPSPTSGGTKPEVTIPDGDPPTKLEIEDIREGSGEEAEAGSTVTAHYIGVSWSTGMEFDSSWNGGEPIQFSLAQVIPGWQQGIPGMKVGGRRRLTIPPDLGYGAQPPPNSGIAPNETLVFVVDLVAVD